MTMAATLSVNLIPFFPQHYLNFYINHPNNTNKARFFLLVDLREFFSDLGSGGGGGGNEKKKYIKKL